MANPEELEKTTHFHAGEERHRPAAQAKLRRLRPAEEDSPGTEEYARLLELYDTSFRSIAEGEVVKGTVLRVTPSAVVVDVGFKSEGLIAIGEFLDERGDVRRRRRGEGRGRRRSPLSPTSIFSSSSGLAMRCGSSWSFGFAGSQRRRAVGGVIARGDKHLNIR